MNKKYYVYGLYEAIEDQLLDNCFYIGKGCGRRMKMHRFESKPKNPHLNNKISKISDYKPKIIRDNLTKEEAFDLEHLLINELYDNLTNINRDWGMGSPSGENHPKYWLDKNRSDRTKSKISKSLSNRNLSDSHKENISKAQKNEKGNRSSILNEEDVSEIKYLLENTDMYQEEIAERYDISASVISNINTGKTWDHVKSKDQP